jgi:L-asparaginase
MTDTDTDIAATVRPQRIVVLGTGGTIAGRARQPGDNIGYTAGEVGVAQLLASAGVAQDGTLALEVEQVAQVDSKDMSLALWQQLAARCLHWLAQDDVDALVITHGTDTLEETAFFLHTVLQPRKPVVLACAMRPATALVPDGPQNLLDAVAVARTAGAQGVLVVCAGSIHGAREVQKLHSYATDAFDSQPAGALGVVEEGRVRRLRPWPGSADDLALHPSPWPDAPALPVLQRRVLETPSAAWPRVEVVLSYAGANGLLVDALVAQGVQGLVVAATGNGTVHADLQAALLRASAAGVVVRRATRCAFGRVLPTAADALTDSAGLQPLKARIALMLQLLAEAP